MSRLWAATFVILWLASGGESVVRGQEYVGIVSNILGKVDVSRRPGAWDLASTNPDACYLAPGDEIRTSRASTALLQIRVGPEAWETATLQPLTRIAMQTPARPMGLLEGVIHFFSRSSKQDWQIKAGTILAAVHGTDFIMEARTNGEVVVRVLEGELDATNETNPSNHLRLTNNTAARYDPATGQLTAVPMLDLHVQQLAQTFLYYPGFLRPADLEFQPKSNSPFFPSYEAYLSGNLREALEKCPDNPIAASEKLFRAALLLTVGEFGESEMVATNLLLNSQSSLRERRVSEAMLQLVYGVQGKEREREEEPVLPTEWLAESYYRQSRTGRPFHRNGWQQKVYADAPTALGQALMAAELATPNGTNFGFGRVRRAELEFSFGRSAKAEQALAEAGEEARENAQAVALRGFLSWARQDYQKALNYFQQARDLDPRLGNAWLGIGLSTFRMEDMFYYLRRNQPFGYWRAQPDSEALRALERAAAVEPERSLLRSYLGKAYFEAAGILPDPQLSSNALEQLRLAKLLDPQDPTPDLYSAFIKHQENRINESILDLQHSLELNDNRQTYRSSLLLDQDRAVRGANLAAIYRDAGMTDVSVHEAANAVNSDYANYSAHLFLANSYNELRDPKQINLRYETPWLSEYLAANLLAPADANVLSSAVSQQEYSRLFERDHLGISSYTEYLSSGDWRQGGAQYGLIGSTAYSLESYYQSQNGQRPNNDLEALTFTARIKQQITPQDSLYLEISRYDYEAGDVTQYLDQSDARTTLRTTETQEPILSIGYHHEWSPGVHTLFLASRQDDTLRVHDQKSELIVVKTDLNGNPIGFALDFSTNIPTAPLKYESGFTAYSAELQQIIQRGKYTTVFGTRYQTGEFDTSADLGTSVPIRFTGYNATLSNRTSVSPDFQRFTLYAYENWRPFEPLLLVGGVAYDHLSFPENYRSAPLSEAEQSIERVSPKAGFVWTPWRQTTVRGAFTRSLGGVSFDQSFRLEPTQVAGFNQSFRSIVPEALVGSVAGEQFQTFGLALEQKIGVRTFLTLSFDLLESDNRRELGAFFAPPRTITDPVPRQIPGSLTQELAYREKDFTFTLNSLLGQNWSVGARYRLVRSELDDAFQDLPSPLNGVLTARSQEATLHDGLMFASFNHPSGFFATAESIWRHQSVSENESGKAHEDLWQFNVYAGWRFLQRRAELRFGCLNLGDEQYALSPVTPYSELPRARTFITSLKLNF